MKIKGNKNVTKCDICKAFIPGGKYVCPRGCFDLDPLEYRLFSWTTNVLLKVNKSVGNYLVLQWCDGDGSDPEQFRFKIHVKKTVFDVDFKKIGGVVMFASEKDLNEWLAENCIELEL